MNYENILTKKSGKILQITINRPAQLNALNRQTIAELSHAFGAAEKDTSVRAIILTGSGDRAFGAGADVKEFANFEKFQGRELSEVGHKTLFNKVENLSTPVIAAINGFALGGGLELAMSCHMRLASDNARLGLPEVTLGLIPGYGGTQRLPQLIGKGRAMAMILSGSMIDAAEAYRIGLVNGVVPQEKLLAEADKIASRIARNSPNAIKAAIRAINASGEYERDGYQTEIDAFSSCFETGDFKEGTRAFLEKRQPEFAD